MFKLLVLEDTIRIPPEKFSEHLDQAGREQLRMKYEGMVDDELGYVVAVTKIKVNPTGKIIPGDGATYHKVSFSLLIFYPKIQEIVEGEVVEIADFGAFVRVGPIDALLHVSQLMDDFISYDERQGVLMGKETRRKLSSGDHIRARVTAVSLARSGGSGKIGVTARQPFLGKIEWIKEEVKKLRSEAEKEKAVNKAKEQEKKQQ
ncbi:MAG: DNA-directed RNA polymerase [Candidatus Bathyarchaeota archaeon]|nr:DNA-directed RNA polymerase [Candidatus Bathyarchaeota archaeon]MDH5495573.1 DNA-directed RNA polymerase [Candidatus Bathyarchaeota archaeon]